MNKDYLANAMVSYGLAFGDNDLSKIHKEKLLNRAQIEALISIAESLEKINKELRERNRR